MLYKEFDSTRDGGGSSTRSVFFLGAVDDAGTSESYQTLKSATLLDLHSFICGKIRQLCAKLKPQTCQMALKSNLGEFAI